MFYAVFLAASVYHHECSEWYSAHIDQEVLVICKILTFVSKNYTYFHQTMHFSRPENILPSIQVFSSSYCSLRAFFLLWNHKGHESKHTQDRRGWPVFLPSPLWQHHLMKHSVGILLKLKVSDLYFKCQWNVKGITTARCAEWPWHGLHSERG